jgi:hypothetical protein
MANLARASLALVLRAVFGGAKSCASVNLFMICPPAGQLMGLTDNDEVLSLITAILWLSNPASTQLGLCKGDSLPPPLSTRRTQVSSWLPLLICNIALQCHEQCLYFAQRVRTKA